MSAIQQFNKILGSFNIKATCIDAKQFDNYFFFDLKLLPNAKVKDIQKYGDEISLALMTPCKPSVKILHEQGIVRLEFVTLRNKPLQLFDFFTNKGVPSGNLVCLLGQTVDGQKVWMDLSKNPHMIVAGSTGSGKSVILHNIIANMLNYNNCEMILVDPKNIEFSEYEKLKLNINVLYSYEETMSTLDRLLSVMESRYTMMRNGSQASEFPYILLIIDEFADLVLQDTDELFYIKLCRLAQKCRAARISIVLSTQRPSANILNGAIKANFSARIACRVASHVDSKVVLDITGAQNLLGKGDAILRDNSRHMERFQVAYTTATEVCNYFGE